MHSAKQDKLDDKQVMQATTPTRRAMVRKETKLQRSPLLLPKDQNVPNVEATTMTSVNVQRDWLFKTSPLRLLQANFANGKFTANGRAMDQDISRDTTEHSG